MSFGEAHTRPTPSGRMSIDVVAQTVILFDLGSILIRPRTVEAEYPRKG